MLAQGVGEIRHAGYADGERFPLGGESFTRDSEGEHGIQRQVVIDGGDR